MPRTFPFRSSPRPAFTLVEVMFSVVILGVGMIMTAAIFPVSIVQRQLNADDSTGASVGASAMATLGQCFSNQSAPATDGAMIPLAGPLRRQVYGNLIFNPDPRYAWVPLYKRTAGDPFAQVVVLVIRNRNRSIYQAGIDLPANPDDVSGQGATLDPAGVTVTTHDGGTGVDTITIDTDPTSHAEQRIAPGSFIVIGSGTTSGVGQVYRIGNPSDAALNTWELSPGWDLASADQEVSGANAYVIGRGYRDPTDTTKGFDGPAQDVAVYCSFVPVK